MKYSLIIHANGPDPRDYNVYLADNESWWRLGLLQSIKLTAEINDLPRLDGGFIGLTILECEKPDLSGGINIFLSNFALFNEPFELTNIIVRKGDKGLTFVKSVSFDVDVNGHANLYLEAFDMVEWLNDIPKWVELKLVAWQNEKETVNG